MLKHFSSLLRVFFILLVLVFCVISATNIIMYMDAQSLPPNSPKEFAIVLGASVHGNELSGALRKRMEAVVSLYNEKLVKNILLSGDGTDSNYSETYAMRKFAIKHHIPPEAIITDEKGYNTYATMLRAKEVFNAKSAYIISQKFHLTRAVWIARKVGINADGVSSGDIKEYYYYYEIREFFARSKDFFQILLKIPPYEEKNTL